MAKAKYIAPNKVQVEVDGNDYVGSYTVDANVVTAEWDGWTDSTQVGASAEVTAKMLVRELVRKHAK